MYEPTRCTTGGGRPDSFLSLSSSSVSGGWSPDGPRAQSQNSVQIYWPRSPHPLPGLGIPPRPPQKMMVARQHPHRCCTTASPAWPLLVKTHAAASLLSSATGTIACRAQTPGPPGSAQPSIVLVPARLLRCSPGPHRRRGWSRGQGKAAGQLRGGASFKNERQCQGRRVRPARHSAACLALTAMLSVWTAVRRWAPPKPRRRPHRLP